MGLRASSLNNEGALCFYRVAVPGRPGLYPETVRAAALHHSDKPRAMKGAWIRHRRPNQSASVR